MLKFWKNKTVLVTGHSGFKGAWLSLVLQQAKAHVIGYALSAPTNPNLFELANIAEGMTSIHGDIRDFDQLSTTIKKHQPEIIIHMAAQPLVRYSYKEPIETYSTNVLGTVHLLEAARQAGCVKTILNITTDKCYENQEWHWAYRETDTLGGHDPYSNSKACSELVTNAYRDSYFKNSGIGIASARAGNVIGGGDWALDRLIPDIIRSCIAGTPITLRYPNALRPWQHVLEPISAYLLLAEKLYADPLRYSSAWNFGPDENDIQPVQWIAENIMQAWHQQSTWNLQLENALHEAKHLKLDCAKAKAQLSWHPQWNLEKGLYETINWYKAFSQGKNMREKTLEQISEFFQKKQHCAQEPAALALEIKS